MKEGTMMVSLSLNKAIHFVGGDSVPNQPGVSMLNHGFWIQNAYMYTSINENTYVHSGKLT